MLTIGDTAVSFTGTDIVSNTSYALSNHWGKVILLTFFGYSCPRCQAEAPLLQSLWQKYAGHIHFVGVNLVSDDAAHTGLNNFIATYGITFPVLQDTASWQIAFPYVGSSISFPTMFFIGADKIIRDYHQGSVLTESEIDGRLMTVLHTRTPVDIEMVMDVSDTMLDTPPGNPSGDSKLVLMKQAVTLIIQHLVDNGQIDDRMGLISFTDDVEEYQSGADKLFSIPNSGSDLIPRVNALGTGTCTAMGAGLQTAFNTLATTTNKHFAILCTDGMQNIEPKVTEVAGHYEVIDSGGWLCSTQHSSVLGHPGVDITTYNTTVHTIGIGATANYEPTLQGVANATGGFYRATIAPQTDLDLIYFVDLCSCLAGSSPAVVHHAAGELSAERCQAVERFRLNRSVQKITVLLSWQKRKADSLTFWLHAPDGTLVKAGGKMKTFETYCMATLYLPWQQDGQTLRQVGEWEMVIRGETETGSAVYHAVVVAEDRETAYLLDYPRKVYEVGDMLPLQVQVSEKKFPVLKVSDIVVEVALPKIPFGELMEKFNPSLYEMERSGMAQMKARVATEALIAAKLRLAESDPKIAGLASPARQRWSLRNGDMQGTVTDKGVVIPVELKQPGLHSFKVAVLCETPGNGPIQRTDLVSVFVSPGKVDPRQSKLAVREVQSKKVRGVVVQVTPRNARGQLLGPGMAHEIEVRSKKQKLETVIEDQLNSTYEVQISGAKKGGAQTPVTITFQGKTLWEGKV